MKPPLEHIRVSQRSRDILVTMKRRTGIDQWNIVCRWAFCDSLANPTPPVSLAHSGESNVEMSWETFAGELSDVFLSVLAMRARIDGIADDKASKAHYFRSHLERGISQLQNAKDLPQLLSKVCSSTESTRNGIKSKSVGRVS